MWKILVNKDNKINTYKDIRFEDFKRRKYEQLIGLRANYKRKLNSVNYSLKSLIMKIFKKIDYLKIYVKNALNLAGMDFTDATFTLEKLLYLNWIFN